MGGEEGEVILGFCIFQKHNMIAAAAAYEMKRLLLIYVTFCHFFLILFNFLNFFFILFIQE